MELFIVIGNLGANAEPVAENGREYIKFNVAETRHWRDQQGQTHEETIWNSCIMNGKQENLLPYLTKGTKVLVMGRGSARVYSSPKLRQMVAGLNIQVDRLELINVNREAVDRQIVSPDGIILDVNKAYWIDLDTARKYAAPNARATFFNRAGAAAYQVDYNGFVLSMQTDAREEAHAQLQADAAAAIDSEQQADSEQNDLDNQPPLDFQ